MVRDLVDQLLAREADLHDLVGRDGIARVHQVMAPARLDPRFGELGLLEHVRRLGEELIGPVEVGVAMVIAKPGQDGGVVPWHQDAVYWTDEERGLRAGSVWIALDDVDTSNGCLQFVTGSHRERVVHPHRHLGDDPSVHARELLPEQVEQVVVDPVAVALRAGEATMHDSFTLHHSGPNVTDRVRRALVLSVRERAGTAST